jgi:hypothetical protein
MTDTSVFDDAIFDDMVFDNPISTPPEYFTINSPADLYYSISSGGSMTITSKIPGAFTIIEGG